MKQRIVTAAVGLTIFFCRFLALYHTVFLNISVAVIIFLALYEMFHVTGVWENKVLSAVCLLFGCAASVFECRTDPAVGWYAERLVLRWHFLVSCLFITNRCITPKLQRLLLQPV